MPSYIEWRLNELSSVYSFWDIGEVVCQNVTPLRLDKPKAVCRSERTSYSDSTQITESIYVIFKVIWVLSFFFTDFTLVFLRDKPENEIGLNRDFTH